MKMIVIDSKGVNHTTPVKARRGYTWVSFFQDNRYVWHEVPIRTRPTIPDDAELITAKLWNKSK